MSDSSFDFNGRNVAGHREIFGPYAHDARYEQRLHTENVYAPESVRERERRESFKRYERHKEELRWHRQGLRPDAQSGS